MHEEKVDPQVSSTLCTGLPFLARINDLARVIALFHRYLDTSGQPLPPIPEKLLVPFKEVKARMLYANLWSELSKKH
jgi:hypothetical protein